VRVGVPTEIKPDEYRLALTPVGARELAEHGHEVLVQAGAGEGSEIAGAGYRAQGAGSCARRRGGVGRANAPSPCGPPAPGERVGSHLSGRYVIGIG